MPNSKSMKQKTVKGMTYIEGSDNIFRDLGFPKTEAVSLLARADLMMAIEKAIEERGITQTAAAKLLGVGQPRLSDLYSGKIERFTIDMLVKWLTKLGKQVIIKVEDVA